MNYISMYNNPSCMMIWFPSSQCVIILSRRDSLIELRHNVASILVHRISPTELTYELVVYSGALS